MNILGLGGSIHDFSCCLVTNNQVYAIEDERLSRVRYALNSRSPFTQSIRYCLDSSGLNLDDIDMVVMNDMLNPILPQLDLSKVTLINHHLSHACSVFYPSPFTESAILVVDGAGSVLEEVDGDDIRETASFYHAQENQIKLLNCITGTSSGECYSENSPPIMSNSLGDFYRVVTEAIGFGFLQAGKTMGLSA